MFSSCYSSSLLVILTSLLSGKKKKTNTHTTKETQNNQATINNFLLAFFFKNENSAPLSMITPGLGQGENELGMTIFFFLLHDSFDPIFLVVLVQREIIVLAC